MFILQSFLLVAVMVLFFIITIPVMLYLKATHEKYPERNSRIGNSMVRWLFKVMLAAGGCSVEVRGRENIPDGAVLYVSNHRSMFDIVVGYSHLPGYCCFIGKKELEKIPFLSSWMKIVSCLFLDRENIREGLKTILAAVEVAKSGSSVWIFPEGTRSHTQEMLEFKEGSMKIADRSGCPIVPIAFKYTDDIWENHFPWIHGTKVYMQYGKPIYPGELSRDEKKVMGAMARTQIQEMIDQMP